MFNLVRWYNQNKEKFWIVILIIFMIIFFIQVINNFYKQNTNKNTDTKSSETTSNNINNKISGTLESSTSLIEGENVSRKNLEEQTLVIDNFIKYCNSGKVEEAYNLLTDECKEELYPSLESFANTYYNEIFSTYKTYSIQNWFGNTYKLKIAEDALATGKIDSNSSHFKEYITVVEKDKEYKLNISSYIGKTILNKEKTVEGININIVSVSTYMDYSEYTVKIKNTTDKAIQLDNGETTSGIYLLDKKNIKEYAHSGEIIYSDLELAPNSLKSYRFTFSNSYSSTREITHLVFENVIMNCDEYNETTDKNNYKFTTITVNV